MAPDPRPDHLSADPLDLMRDAPPHILAHLGGEQVVVPLAALPAGDEETDPGVDADGFPHRLRVNRHPARRCPLLG